MQIDEELAAAEEIARDAGDVVLSYFRSDRLNARGKGERDVVTAADEASERLVVERLRETFPGDGIVAEEGGAETGRSERLWYIDPLDGTVNYSRGVPIWCVSISLFENGQPRLGVIHDPLGGTTFTAGAGHGARRDGHSITCSQVETLPEALVHLTIDFNEASLLAGLDDIREIAPRVLRTRNIGSAAMALAFVAAGHFDAMIHRFANPWDYGAGVLLVREAGGTVIDLAGGPYSAGTSALLASGTIQLQTQLLSLIDRPGTV